MQTVNLIFIDTSVCIVDCVFWFLLTDTISQQSSIERKVLIIIQHSANLCFLIIDYKTSQIELRKHHILGPVAFILTFIIFTWICVALGMWDYPYPFFKEYLDISNASIIIIILSILTILIVNLIFYAIIYVIFNYQRLNPSTSQTECENEDHEGLIEAESESGVNE